MIDKNLWHNCQVCNKNIKELSKQYGGNGVYYSQVFEQHLIADHQLSINEYFLNICKLDVKECACGICKRPVDIVKNRSQFDYRKYSCGRNLGVIKWSKQAKIDRLGQNNPMYGKRAWNKNLSKETDPRIKKISTKRLGISFSDKTKEKMSIAAKARKIHGHSGYRHSAENKEKFRVNTLKMIRDGKYSQTKTKPHIILSEILSELSIQYIEEYVVWYWSFDFYLPELNIFIEVDGDYFHSNPKIYPIGPQTKTQKINYYRDIKKNKYCLDHGLHLIRLWESDVLSPTIREKLCELLKL